MELPVLCTCMEGKKNGEPWTWLHLSLANWESEAWVKYIWGHRKWLSIPLKDHRSLKSITGLVHNLIYKPFSTNCSIHVWFCVVKFLHQIQTTHGHSLLLHLTSWFAVRSAEADILLQFVQFIGFSEADISLIAHSEAEYDSFGGRMCNPRGMFSSANQMRVKK
jgi:hypothetical protein